MAIDAAGSLGEGRGACRALLRGLYWAGAFRGARPVVPGDHGGIEAAARGELAGAGWQRCVVRSERNALSRVSAASTAEEEVARAPKGIFEARREKTARALAEEFVGLYGRRFPKAISVFGAGVDDALACPGYPGGHHARIRATNTLGRLFEEAKGRTGVVGAFPGETSASTLATGMALRSSEQRALKRYLAMDALEVAEKPNPRLSRH